MVRIGNGHKSGSCLKSCVPLLIYAVFDDLLDILCKAFWI